MTQFFFLIFFCFLFSKVFSSDNGLNFRQSFAAFDMHTFCNSLFTILGNELGREKTGLQGFQTDLTNRPVQLQKQARSLKFRI